MSACFPYELEVEQSAGFAIGRYKIRNGNEIIFAPLYLEKIYESESTVDGTAILQGELIVNNSEYAYYMIARMRRIEPIQVGWEYFNRLSYLVGARIEYETYGLD